MGIAPDDAGGRRSHHHHLGRLAQLGVGDRLGAVEERRPHGLGGQGGEGHRSHEAGGTLGHHGHDMGAGVDQAAADLDRLVRGDSTTDPKDDPPSFQVVHVPPAT